MFDLNRRYNRRYNRPIVALIVDQTCTFQCVIPMGDLSKIVLLVHADQSKVLFPMHLSI